MRLIESLVSRSKSAICIAACCPILIVPSIRGEEKETDSFDGPWISSLAWLDGQQLVGCSSQGLLLRPAQIVKANVDSLNQLEKIGEAETSLWRILLSIDSQIFASDYKGGVHIYDGEQSEKLETDARWIRALASPPSEDELLAGTEDGKLLLLSLGDRSVEKSVQVHDGAIFDIALSPIANMIATAGGDGRIKLLSWPDLNVVDEMSRGNEAIWSLLFTSDGKKIVSGGADRRIQLWDVENAESICTMARTRNWITDLVALPDSKCVIASCMDGKLVIADVDTLSPVEVVDAAKSAIWSIALEPEGNRLALGTRKHGFQLVSVEGWAEKAARRAAELDKLKPPSPKETE